MSRSAVWNYALTMEEALALGLKAPEDWSVGDVAFWITRVRRERIGMSSDGLDCTCDTATDARIEDGFFRARPFG